MAQYRVTEKSFLDGVIRNEGDIIEYNGEVGPNLVPVKKQNVVSTEYVDDTPDASSLA